MRAEKICCCCARRFGSAEGCSWNAIHYQDEYRERIRFGSECGTTKQERCPHCGVGKGEYHHAGCEFEELPFSGVNVKMLLNAECENARYAKLVFSSEEKDASPYNEQVI